MLRRHFANLIGRRHHGWAIFALVFTNLTVEGAMKNSAPVVFLALRESFGRSAAATAGIFSAAGLTGALCAPLLGKLFDRVGPRYLFPVGGLLILVGYLSSSLVSDFWQLFILYGLIATLGETTISSFTATANLAPWFPRARGRVLGLADAGNPLGQGIFVPLAGLLISSMGWRSTFRIFGPLFFLMVAPANFLFQRRPPIPEVGVPQENMALEVIETPSAVTENMEFKQLLRTWPLWCLVSARSFASFGTQLTNLHMVAFFVVAGYSPIQAASILGAVGLLGLAGRPISGALSDYLGRELIYTLGMGMQVGAIVLVLVFGDGHSLWPIVLFVGLSGLSDGIGGLAVSAKAADLFPANALGSVMGLVQGGRGVGIMLGPILGGLLFDLRGDYMVAFSLAMSLVLVAIAFMWTARFTTGTLRS
ncbi:MAG: MFS transporter [Chloroflexi bacterium]|nr:MFS transporter [Chloroflexota bacterium]